MAGSWWLKLNRAEEHRLILDGLVADYIKAADLRLVTSPRNPAGDGTAYVFEANFDPPEELATTIGDCAHNLRSALDHIYWTLPQNPRPPAWRILFPIEANRAKLEPKVAGLRPEHVDIIRKAQPFNNVYEPFGPFTQWVGPWLNGPPQTNHPLDMLQRISNTDKHQTLLLGASSYSHMLWYGDTARNINRGPWARGDIVVEFDASARIDPEPQPEFDVAFAAGPPGYGQRVVQTLEGIDRFIKTHVIAPIERLEWLSGT